MWMEVLYAQENKKRSKKYAIKTNSADHQEMRGLGVRRILIVEDEYLVAMSIEDAVTALGWEVIGIAPDSAQALKYCEESRPDFVTMDLRLANDESGAALGAELRNRFGLRCLFISAHLNDEDQKRQTEIEALGFLAKPFTHEALKDMLIESAKRLLAH